MSDFGVDISMTTTEVATLTAETANIEVMLEKLEQAAQSFLGTNQGFAVENFHLAQQEWNNGVLQMRDALHAQVGALGTITESYVNTDLLGSKLFG